MFLCTGNACRSQMAEAFARELGKGVVDPYSSGLIAVDLHPYAVEAMMEVGIDISGQKSKEIDPELFDEMDVVVTLCKPAEFFSPRSSLNTTRIYRPITAPVSTGKPKEDIMKDFRRTRDEIRVLIEELLREISSY
ncbi:MAG TPA: arsenate reductase ArsC [Dissulfurispiraceae bacterium]|nr:arsenate reductase ArsC [Dissulfurispiraceae bacterium]